MYIYRPAESGRAAMLRESAIKCETEATNMTNADIGGSTSNIDDEPSAADSKSRSRLTGRAPKPVP